MKKIHLLAIIVICVALGASVSHLMKGATYAQFTQAMQNPNKKLTVAGDLVKEAELLYQPLDNPNLFSFYMRDKGGKTVKVLLNQAKPQDFERAEGLVVTGKMIEDTFYATEVLLKCPSKYNEQNTFAQK